MNRTFIPNSVLLHIFAMPSQTLKNLLLGLFFVLSAVVSFAASAQTTLNSGATINITMNQGQSFSQSFVGTGSLDNTYTLNGTTPPGISVTTISAPPPATFGHHMLLSGTPTASGTYTFNIDVIASLFSASVNYSTTLVVTVLPPAPSATNSNQTVLSNSSNNVITPSTSGSVTSIGIVTAPSHGSAVVSGTTIIYTPAASYVGSDTISFQATGPGGSSSTATITINVTPPAPSVATTNTTVTSNSSNNLISPNITGTATSLNVISTPAHGSATVSGLTVLYTPSAGYSGSDTFLVTATGPGGTSSSASVNITVAPPAPSVAALSATVASNSSNNSLTPVITGSATSISVTSTPAHGSATVSGLIVLYTPSAGYSGSDSFLLTATGPGGTSVAATISITVTPPAPSVAAMNATVAANSSNNTIAPVITGTATSIAIASTPLHGSASVSGMNVLYTPSAGYSGSDSFSVTATGPGGTSSAASVSVTITPPAPSISALSTTVAANSSNNTITPVITGSVTSIALASSPTHGSAVVSGLTVRYTPSAGYSGNDSFLVTATGPGGTSSAASMSITVTPPPPTVASTSTTVAANSSNNTISPSVTGTASSMAIATTPAHGSATVSGLNILYTPSAGYSGVDSFSVTVTGPGGTSSAANINVTITPPAPSISGGSTTVAANSTGNLITPTITDTVSSITIASTPAHGVASVSGLTVLYTPSAGYDGNDSFSVTATGPGGTSAAASFSVTVTPPAPSVSASSVNVASNSSNNSISPTISGNASSVSIVSAPLHGSASASGLGLLYTPAAGYSGSDSITVTVSGPGGTSSAATISISVIAAAVAPSIANGNLTVAANSSGNTYIPTITGSASTISIVSAPLHGTASVSGLSINFTPSASYSGNDSLSITASGPGGTSAPATINIVVNPPAPAVSSSNVTVAANSPGNSITPTVTGVANNIILNSLPAHGTASVNGLTVLYVPNNGYVGTDSFTFSAAGPGGTSTTAVLNISVVASAPVLSGSEAVVAGNSSNNLLTPTITGIATAINMVSGPSHGTAIVSGFGIVYTPARDYSGPDSVTVVATGPGGSSAPLLIKIAVDDLAPTASNSTATVITNSVNNSLNPSVVGNATSTFITLPANHGTASVSGSSIIYTPNSGYVGPDVITFVATGPGGSSNPATISINVVSASPAANNSSVTVIANSNANTITPVITGNINSISIVSPTAHGSISVDGLKLIYTPNSGYIGPDAVSFAANGVSGTSASAVISITVVPSNSTVPTIKDLDITVLANSSLNTISPQITGVANSLTITAMPQHGLANTNGLQTVYTPTKDYIGADELSITATGPGGTSAPAKIRITVVPTPPTVAPNTVQIAINSSGHVIIPVITGIANALSIVAPPAHGKATLSGLTLIYTPNPDYAGDDSLSVIATGPGGSSAPATIRIAVTATVPSIISSSISVIANSTGNIITPRIVGGASAISVSKTTAHGTININGLNISYTPTTGYVGPDAVTLVASGTGGNSSPTEILIEVKPLQATKVSVTVQANSAANLITLPTIAGAANIVLNGQANHGVASVEGLGVRYTPSNNFVGSDALAVQVIGGNGMLTSIDIDITVVATAPIAGRARLTVESGRTATIDLAGVISGPTYNGVTISVSQAPSHGVFSIIGTKLSFTANSSFNGNDSLLFTATTLGGTSKAAILDITITARPDPSNDRGVLTLHNATTAMVRHFEQVQIDQFNGRLLELASKDKPVENTEDKPSKASCGQIGMWVSGLNSYGSYRGRDGSKFTTMGYSAGADRCFGSSNTTVGIGLGYARDHNEMPLSGANLTASANTIASYASTKIIPALRLSFVAGVNQIGSRYQRLETNANTQVLGEWHGNQIFSSSAITGDVDLALIKISPFVKMDISNLSLDPYTETGASPYLLHYHQQSMRSQRSTMGFNSEMTIETPWGELIPRFRMEVQRDAAKRNSLKINYVDFPDAIYLIPSNEIDRRVALIAFGADMNWKNGIVTIINVTRTSANQNNQNNRINVRFSYKY